MEAINNIEIVRIGRQIWQKRNLNVDTFRNGEPITKILNDEQWEQRNANGKPAWCHFDNEQKNELKFGKLYNWWAVNDQRELAPLGFHIPSDDEWMELISFSGGMDYAGNKLKSLIGWKKNGNGVDENGFSAFPNGRRYLEGSFDNFENDNSYWWSATESNKYMAWFWNLYFHDGKVVRNQAYKDAGMCVRCIAD